MSKILDELREHERTLPNEQKVLIAAAIKELERLYAKAEEGVTTDQAGKSQQPGVKTPGGAAVTTEGSGLVGGDATSQTKTVKEAQVEANKSQPHPLSGDTHHFKK